jgi:hypothetical protein
MCRDLESNVLACKIQRERGQAGIEEVDVQLLNASPTEQSQSIMQTLLLQAWIASFAGNAAPTDLVERWSKQVRELQGYPWMSAWFESAKQAFTASTPDAINMMGDSRLPSDARLLAAARLLNDTDAGVDRMFNAQIWIVGYLGQSKMFWNYDAANHFASHLASVWKRQCAFRATLRNPRLTVPEIERECDSTYDGIAKAARILLAAANAVTMQMSDDARKQLQTLASHESLNPYRFA